MEVFEHGPERIPVEIARAAIEHARYYGRDMVIIDTAGRLHIDEKLMQELRDVRDAVKPQEILLVVDAMTGQDAVNVADTFNQRTGHRRRHPHQARRRHPRRRGHFREGRDGQADQVRRHRAKSWPSSEPFHPDRMASRILGMGDVLSLIEKAQRAQSTRKRPCPLTRKMRTDSPSHLEDYLEQMQQLSNMGSISERAEDDSRRGQQAQGRARSTRTRWPRRRRKTWPSSFP